MKEKENKGRDFNPLGHKMVPKHEIIDETELKKTLSEYNIEKEQMPKICVTDPAAVQTQAKVGDVVRITRNSQTAGIAIYYRLVIA
jgi:DNA-directed RNA polymerase subunit H